MNSWTTRNSLIALACALASGASAGNQPGAANAPATVPFSEFLSRLDTVLDEVPPPPALRAEFEEFCVRHKLQSNNQRLWRDFRRLKLIFEATRDAGMWRVRWSVTDRPPNSKEIWRQWMDGVPDPFGPPTATAECDELSALTAFLARRMGVRGVGLFWPTCNHTIAAWELPAKAPAPEGRALIPTSQIFLDCDATFDRTSFDARSPPSGQRKVFEYGAIDVSQNTRLPAPLVEFLLTQLRVYGGAQPDVLKLLRFRRNLTLASSLRGCSETARSLAGRLGGTSMSEADNAALVWFARTELGPDAPKSPPEILKALGRE